MKKLLFQSVLAFACFSMLYSCGNKPQENGTEAPAMTTSADSANADEGWKLGVQMWTFNHFTFTEGIQKADSAGIKFIEAYLGQPLGGDMKDTFGLNMSKESRSRIKTLLAEKGMRLMAMGVVVPQTPAEWKQTFEFAKDMGVQYITAEPKREHWDTVNTMAGEYSIMVAIHDHPRPSPYDHPDSVLNAINGRINMGACADIGHWTRNGLDPAQCLKTLEGRIIGLHFKDVKEAKPDGADMIVGTGIIKFQEVFAELKRQNFKGMFSIEREDNWLNNVPDVIQTRKFFEEHTKK
jgi:sugar phosphate isomerase/epimerase